MANLGSGVLAGPITGDRRTPTPRIKGNLPPSKDLGEDRGHEVAASPPEWYERANPRSSGLGSLMTGPWEDPRDIKQSYAKGGLVKAGSPTNCRTCFPHHRK